MKAMDEPAFQWTKWLKKTGGNICIFIEIKFQTVEELSQPKDSERTIIGKKTVRGVFLVEFIDVLSLADMYNFTRA